MTGEGESKHNGTIAKIILDDGAAADLGHTNSPAPVVNLNDGERDWKKSLIGAHPYFSLNRKRYKLTLYFAHGRPSGVQGKCNCR